MNTTVDKFQVNTLNDLQLKVIGIPYTYFHFVLSPISVLPVAEKSAALV